MAIVCLLGADHHSRRRKREWSLGGYWARALLHSRRVVGISMSSLPSFDFALLIASDRLTVDVNGDTASLSNRRILLMRAISGEYGAPGCHLSNNPGSQGSRKAKKSRYVTARRLACQ
jgi:hypothetical protein